MATQITVDDFFTELDNLTNGKFSNISNARRLQYLNEAFVNRYSEMVNFAPSVYNLKSVLQFLAQSYVVDLPSDMEVDQITADYAIHWDNSYSPSTMIGGKNIVFWLDGRQLRFEIPQSVNQVYYLAYTKEASQYSSPGDAILETTSPRAKAILRREVESIRDSDAHQGMISPQSAAANAKANNIS